MEKVVLFRLSGWNRCGKPAADAFCRSKGFKDAFTFQRNESQASTATNFRQINCGLRTKTTDAMSGFQPLNYGFHRPCKAEAEEQAFVACELMLP